MTRARRAWLPALPVALVVVVAAGAGAVARGEAAKRPPASQAVVAKQLAKRVMSARTPAARYRALQAVMRALRVGVYSRQGRPLVRGAEWHRRDFAVYDFELRAMARALARGELYEVADVARFLTALGAKPGGQPVQPEAVRQTLRLAVRIASQRPRDPRAAALLLARELGRRHPEPYDLAADVPTEKLRLDALQYFLVNADLAVPLIRQALPRQRAALRQPAVKLPGDCTILKYAADPAWYFSLFHSWLSEQIQSEVAKAGGQVGGEVVKGLVGELVQLERELQGSKLVDKIDKAMLWKDVLHGMLLALSIKAEALTTSVTQQFTHYGPAGHEEDAGRELRYEVRVTMLDDYKLVGRCLKNLGVADIPPPGPIEGIKVIWWPVEGHLEQYGSVRLDPADQLTNKKGIAAIVFTPKDEVVPGLGTEKTARGVLNAYPLYQQKFGANVGTLAQHITPKWAGPMAWNVRYHEHHVFDASITGRQTTSWTLMRRDVWSTPCGVNADGQGDQTIDLGTFSPTRLAFYRDEAGAWQIRGVNRGRRPPVDFPMVAQIARSGYLDLRDASPGRECAGGGTGGPPPPPPPSDCGTRPADIRGTLDLAGAALRVGGRFDDPFQRCPVSGSHGSALVDANAPLPVELIDDPLTGRIIVSASGSAPYDLSQVTQLSNGTSTTEVHASNSIAWNLTLDRR